MANVGPNLAASIGVPRTHYMDYLKHPHEKTFSLKRQLISYKLNRVEDGMVCQL
jgi:hypothetical protein